MWQLNKGNVFAAEEIYNTQNQTWKLSIDQRYGKKKH